MGCNCQKKLAWPATDKDGKDLPGSPFATRTAQMSAVRKTDGAKALKPVRKDS